MMSRMTLKFTGKILLFKSLSIASDEVYSDFQRVPADITFAQAIEMMKGEQAKLAVNGKAGTPTDSGPR